MPKTLFRVIALWLSGCGIVFFIGVCLLYHSDAFDLQFGVVLLRLQDGLDISHIQGQGTTLTGLLILLCHVITHAESTPEEMIKYRNYSDSYSGTNKCCDLHLCYVKVKMSSIRMFFYN